MKKSYIATLVCGIGMILSTAGGVAVANEATDCSAESRYPLITKTELSKVVESKDALVIDVNSKESYKKVHVPGAIHFGSHEKDIASVLPAQKDKMIVAYCGGVKCTAWKKAAETACKMGYTNIRHFKEGLQGWVAKN